MPKCGPLQWCCISNAIALPHNKFVVLFCMHAIVLFAHFSRVEVAVSAFVLLLEYSGGNSPGSSVRSACGGHLTRGPNNIVFQCAAAVDALLHGNACILLFLSTPSGSRPGQCRSLHSPPTSNKLRFVVSVSKKKSSGMHKQWQLKDVRKAQHMDVQRGLLNDGPRCLR